MSLDLGMHKKSLSLFSELGLLTTLIVPILLHKSALHCLIESIPVSLTRDS